MEISPTALDVLKSLGLDVGEAWPRLEWVLTPASAWRTNVRGDSYPVFGAGAELFVSVRGVPLDDADGAMFLHGPSGTERMPLASNGIFSFGTPAAGRWACALLPFRTSVRPTTLLFEVDTEAHEPVSAAWTVVVPEGLGSLEATAPPGWPISVRWGGIAAHEGTIAVVYGNDDRTVSLEGVHLLLEDRATRSSTADLVVDFRELGRRVVPHEGRASLTQIREQLITLWEQRSGLVQSRKGMWLQLVPAWFEPTMSRLGYGLEPLVIPANEDVPHDLAAWLLTVDERTMGSIARSPSRVLVLTTDVDSVLRDMRPWIDDACAFARVRDAIVTDGTQWTVHRKGDRKLRRRAWSLADATSPASVDDMLNELTEGL
jgi:hypothetical protein